MNKTQTLIVQETEITLLRVQEEDYVSLTDIAKRFGEGLIDQWMRNRDTIEFLGEWERINNSQFNMAAFKKIEEEAGYNKFSMSTKTWASETNAIGIYSRAGRYHSGTFAHKEIALDFCCWLYPGFKTVVFRQMQKTVDLIGLFKKFYQKQLREKNLKLKC